VLQSVAECCSVLQSVAECCRVLQCVAECCRVLQCVAECCRVLCWRPLSVWCRVRCSVPTPFVNQCAGAHPVLLCACKNAPQKSKLLWGSSRGILRGSAPQALAPQEAPRKEPSRCTSSATLMGWLQLVGSLKL